MDIVLIEPQIPQNTGSIARTCAALKIPLHIIGEIPFEISDRTVRRAGLDYWPWVELHRHDTWDAYVATRSPSQCWFLSTHGTRIYSQAAFGQNDALVFGSESKGLGPRFMETINPLQILKIPILEPEVRSLNLSNAVSILAYEAYRQLTLGH